MIEENLDTKNVILELLSDK